MAFPIAVLISGKGSNLLAILEAIECGRCGAQVRGVLADRDSAEGLRLATERGIPTRVVKLSDYPNRAHWDHALAEAVLAFDPKLVVLAGFMKLLGPPMIERFGSRIINVHPSLLPLFPGTDAPAQAIRAGVRISGCSIHLVDRGVDTGTIIAQAAVAVLPLDDVASLHARIQRAEHRLLPGIVDAIAKRQIVLDGATIVVPGGTDDERMLGSPSLSGDLS